MLSIDGKLYFITFIDDFTWHCWVYFTNRKDTKTIHNIYIQWKADAENKANATVSYLQTDHGSECEKDMVEILNTGGTTHIPSPLYSHESNGLAERQNRTPKDTARTLLRQANIPSSFWTKAIKATGDIRNHLPHSSLPSGISPHKAFFNEKPSLDCFCFFSSITYIHISAECHPPQSTWNARATKGVIVEYPSSTLYKYYDLQCHKFYRKHNLTIHENEFVAPQDFDPKISISSSIVSDLTRKPLYEIIVVQKSLKIVNSALKQTDEKPTYRNAIIKYNKDKWIAAMYSDVHRSSQTGESTGDRPAFWDFGSGSSYNS